MAIEKYFGMELFKNDLTRVFYASPEYSLRRRLDMLNKNSEPQYHSLDLPFMSYYRKGNWEVDRERLAVENAKAAIFGSPEFDGVPIRFMNTKAQFSAYAVFSRDDEAQIAHETLLWIKHPSVKQFSFPGLAYNDYKLDLPIQLQIDEINFNPTFKETDWLKQNRMIVIEFTFSLRSVIIAPVAQGPKSSLFRTEADQSPFYLTKEAYLDYFSSRNLPLPDEQYMDLSVIGSFTNDPALEGVFSATSITDTAVTLTWDYNAQAATLYEQNVKISLQNGASYDVPMSAKTYTITGLAPSSKYEISLWFFSVQDSVNEYTLNITTAEPTGKVLKLKTIPSSSSST